MVNQSMPGLVKVGRTTRTSEKRARELRTTGVALAFVVVWDEFVDDAAAVEREAHRRLHSFRESSKREFFRVSPKQATATLIEVAAPHRISSPLSGEVAPILAELVERNGDIFDRRLIDVSIVVTATGVKLRSTRVDGTAAERTVQDTDLGFVYSDDDPWFDVEASAQENATRFLELDELSLVMTTALVRDEEAHRIDREQNPLHADRGDCDAS